MNLPRITTTSEIVRNISLITEADPSKMQIITKNVKKLGVYIPMELYEKMVAEGVLINKNKTSKKRYNVPSSLRKKLSKLHPLKYQREIRNEY